MSTQTISSILTTCNARAPLKNTDLITNLVNGAPGTLDTLKEIDTALNNDPNFATTLTTLIGTKLDSSVYNAADILAKIKTVDGTSSGLDADLLQGHSSSYFLAATAKAASAVIADSATLAATATKLATARTINGVAFDGTANITVADSTKEPVIAAGTSTQYWRGDKTWATLPTIPTTVSAFTNDAGYQTSAQVVATKVNASVAADTATLATKLATARTINGVAFDGTANITVLPPAATSANYGGVKVYLSGTTLTITV